MQAELFGSQAYGSPKPFRSGKIMIEEVDMVFRCTREEAWVMLKADGTWTRDMLDEPDWINYRPSSGLHFFLCFTDEAWQAFQDATAELKKRAPADHVAAKEVCQSMSRKYGVNPL